ncbi:MAG: hypothetical protein AAFX03_02750 [Pseudomonadota bacterium]
MLNALTSAAGDFAVLLIGLAVGAAWIVAIVAPNCSYDRLDASRADGHVRQLLVSASTPIAGLLLASTALALLGGAWGAGILAAIAAIGFFTNQWTLAPKKRGETPPGVRRRRKSQRVVAVSLTLLFGGVAAIAGVLAVLDI